MSKQFSQPGGSYLVDPETGKRTLVEQTQPREINRLDNVKKKAKKATGKKSVVNHSKGDK